MVLCAALFVDPIFVEIIRSDSMQERLTDTHPKNVMILASVREMFKLTTRSIIRNSQKIIDLPKQKGGFIQ